MIKPLLSTEWVSRLNQFNQLFIGFSGGLDSTVLLHVLASCPDLVSKLVAVHVNHGISANASFWQMHCQNFCQHLNIPLVIQSVQFDHSANIEERARIARYAVFSSLISSEDCLILGHHKDDQAETVLLQLFRGAGIDGLSAMPDFGSFERGRIARPFLHCIREHLEHYAALHQLNWIEDESNQDLNYSRNYLRQQVIPLLKKRWPGVIGNIARTAIHAQGAKRNLDLFALQDASLKEPSEQLMNSTLSIASLKHLNRDRISNILRVWLKNNKVQLPSTVTFGRLVDEVIFASSDATPEVIWDSVKVRRFREHLYIEKKIIPHVPSALEWSSFPKPLVHQNKSYLIAKKSGDGLVVPPNTKISVRCRQGGENIIWHGQTKRLKKLFQEWNIPPWIRDQIPLIYFNDTLAAVVGYAMSDLFFSKKSSDAWVITQSEQ